MSVRLTTPRARLVGVLLVALAVTVFGVTQLVSALGDPEPTAPTSQVASLDSLTTQVSSADWLSMDHDMSAPGYQMPAQMMPGAPEKGQMRLSVRLSVVNSSADTRPIQPTKEFTLHSGKDGKWSAQKGTFGDLPRLAPGNAVDGVLFFDLPPDGLASGPTWIEWTRGDTSTRLAIPLNGAVPEHSQHTP